MKTKAAEAFVNAILASQAGMAENLAKLKVTLEKMSVQLAQIQPPRTPVFPPEVVTKVTGAPYFVDVTFDPPGIVSEPDPPIDLNAAADVAPGAATVDLRNAWMREALQSVLDALDAWIEGAKENHKACGHRAEPVGSECWRSFHPTDFRTMVNDAARDVGLKPFPRPDDPAEYRP